MSSGIIRFDGRVAIVTGAGRGLGRSYALLLAARGAKVLVNDLGGDTIGAGGSSVPALEVVREIEDAGGVAAADAHSVATLAGGTAIVEAARERWGRVDIVINNAGTGAIVPQFEDLPDTALHAIISTHLYGAFNVLRPAWRCMKRQGYGRIVNTSSSTVLGVSSQYDYAAAKGGIIGLSRSLALDGAQHNIKVNVVMPLAATRLALKIPDPTVRQWLEGNFPVHKVAPLVAWLCHEDVPATGEIFTCGGGRAARMFFGIAPGFISREPSLEEVRAHFEEIMDTKDFVIGADSSADAAMFASQSGRAAAEPSHIGS